MSTSDKNMVYWQCHVKFYFTNNPEASQCRLWSILLFQQNEMFTASAKVACELLTTISRWFVIFNKKTKQKKKTFYTFYTGYLRSQWSEWIGNELSKQEQLIPGVNRTISQLCQSSRNTYNNKKKVITILQRWYTIRIPRPSINLKSFLSQTSKRRCKQW